MIFCRYFCDIPCDISIKWTKKRAIFFCDCDTEKNPCDTLFYKLYHIAPALMNSTTGPTAIPTKLTNQPPKLIPSVTLELAKKYVDFPATKLDLKLITTGSNVIYYRQTLSTTTGLGSFRQME